eukprot:gene40758-53931_t
MFDGSSIAGWKSIDQSDMKLMPDAASVYMDPFYAEKTLCVHCNVVEPDTNEAYDRCPRQIALKAEAYLKASGIGDTAYFGPEAEFFIFDDVRYSVTPQKVSYQLDAEAASWNTDTVFEGGNSGHRAAHKGGYFPVPPMDSAQDMRSEMLAAMAQMGVTVEKHHHEALGPSHAITNLSDALPALGIVAAVLGVIKTMGAITEPPEVLGEMIGSALVGTFLGILLAYGFVGPLASLLEQKLEEETKMYQCVKVTLLASLNGYAPQLAVEFGRKVLFSGDRPSFTELEGHVKGKK